MFLCNGEDIKFGMNMHVYMHAHIFIDIRMRLMGHHLFIHLSNIFGKTTMIYVLC